MTKFFILDDNQKPTEVSEEEHSAWHKRNLKKYNREFSRFDGTKQITLTFQGTQEENNELCLFSVRSVFRGYDGSIINDFTDDFASFQEATEHYEAELFLNGDVE